MSGKISVATYNILSPFYAVKWGNEEGLNDKGQVTGKKKLRRSASRSNPKWEEYSNWSKRLSKVAHNITLADIVCLQEVTPEIVEQLSAEVRNSRYQLAAKAWHPSSLADEKYGNCIFFHSAAIVLKDSFEIPYQFDKAVRVAACAVFKTEKITVAVASVHLKGYDPKEPDLNRKLKAKIAGFEELAAYRSELEKKAPDADCYVIAGDLNEDPTEAKYDLYRPGYLEKQGYLTDGSREVTEPRKKRRIDWVFFKSSIPVRLTSMPLERTHLKASDHLMTGTIADWAI